MFVDQQHLANASDNLVLGQYPRPACCCVTIVPSGWELHVPSERVVIPEYVLGLAGYAASGAYLWTHVSSSLALGTECMLCTPRLLQNAADADVFVQLQPHDIQLCCRSPRTLTRSFCGCGSAKTATLMLMSNCRKLHALWLQSFQSATYICSNASQAPHLSCRHWTRSRRQGWRPM